MKLIFPLTIVATLLITGNIAFGAQFYRWVDKEGSTFIQGNIPPEYVAGGYDIIDDRGNLVKRVAPEISEAERKAQQAQQLSADMQRARDEELLKLYRSPSDVDRAMNTWLSRMDMEIRVKKNRIRIKENEYDSLQEQAANLEKTGREIDNETLEKMDSITVEIDRYNNEITEVEKRQNEARDVFLLDRDRMVTLWEMINKKTWVDPTEN